MKTMPSTLVRNLFPRGSTFFSAGAGILLVALLLAPTNPTVQECELTFEPSHVEAGSETTLIEAVPSEDVGEVTAVSAERESGLHVRLLSTAPLHLEVNATEANEGEWQIALESQDGPVCTGRLGVAEPGR